MWGGVLPSLWGPKTPHVPTRIVKQEKCSLRVTIRFRIRVKVMVRVRG